MLYPTPLHSTPLAQLHSYVTVQIKEHRRQLKETVSAARVARHFTMVHFVGSSAPDVRSVVGRLCRELKRWCGVREGGGQQGMEEEEDWKVVKDTFSKLLYLAAYQAGDSRRVLLVIDGLDQLSSSDRAHSLDWLPATAPVRVVVTSASSDGPDHGMCLEVLRKRNEKAKTGVFVEVEGLSMEERRDMVRKVLHECRKKLEEEDQLTPLVSKTDASMPLYLALACEELRVFGSFDRLSHRIHALPASVPQLFEDLLSRLESDIEAITPTSSALSLSTIARKPPPTPTPAAVTFLKPFIPSPTRLLLPSLLSLLACARDGLLESDLLLLLAHRPMPDLFKSLLKRLPTPPEPLPHAVWAPIMRALRPYLRTKSEGGDLRFHLFHPQLHVAVTKRYLSKVSGATPFHRHLAFHLLGEKAKASKEAVYHLVQAGMWSEVEGVLTDLSFIEGRCNGGSVHALLGDYALALGEEGEREEEEELMLFRKTSAAKKTAAKLSGEGRERVKEFAKFVRANAHVLAVKPHLTLQQAFNSPSTSAPFIAAQSILSKREPSSPPLPGIVWCNKPKHTDPCLMTVKSHEEAVTACAIKVEASGAGHIVTARRDGTVRVYDAETGAEKSVLEHDQSPLACCAFQKNGRLLVSGSWSGSLKVWDVLTGVEVSTLNGHTRRVNSVVFSPDGVVIVSGSWDRTVRVWHTVSGRCLATLDCGNKPINAVAFAKSLLACVTWDSTLKIWEVDTINNGRVRRLITLSKAHSSSIRDCVMSPDGKLLATLGLDESVRMWELGREGEVACTLVLNITGLPLTALSFSADGSVLATATRHGAIVTWDALGSREVQCFKARRSGEERANRFASQGASASTPSLSALVWWEQKHLLIAGDQDGYLHIWDVALPSNPARLIKAHNDPISAVCRVLDNCLVTASHDRTLRVWEYPSMAHIEECIMTGHSDVVTTVTSDGEDIIVSGSSDGTVRIWQIISSSEWRELSCLSASAQVTAVSTNKSASVVVAAARDGSVIVWDLQVGMAERRIQGHFDWCTSVDLRQDSIVTTSWEGTAKLWNSISLTEVHELKHPDSVTASHFVGGGQRLVTGSLDGSVHLWKLHAASNVEPESDESKGAGVGVGAGAEVEEAVKGMESEKMTGHKGTVCSLQSEESGEKVFSASSDGSVRVWSVTAGTQLTTLSGHGDAVRGICYGEDGKLVSASDDKTAKVWDPRLTGTTAAADDSPQSSQLCARIECACMSPDGTRVAIASQRSVLVLDSSDPSVVFMRVELRHTISACTYDAAATRLLVGDSAGDVVVIDANTADITATYDACHSTITGLAIDERGRMVASSWDGCCHVIQLRPSPGGRPPVVDISAVHLSSDWLVGLTLSGEFAMASSFDGGLYKASVFDKGNAKIRTLIAPMNECKDVTCMAMSPTGTQYALGSANGTLVIVSSIGTQVNPDPLTFRCLAMVSVCRFMSPDLLLVASHDHWVRVLHIADRAGGPTLSVKAEFECRAPVTALDYSSVTGSAIVGDIVGNVYSLDFIDL
mmetsp:Transcript_13076/g.21445  ORF Transcript_13076/g.21445 Transcript_13076/m.21445 type:complete len:1525 (+) Transcript_13076:181-4755(+)